MRRRRNPSVGAGETEEGAPPSKGGSLCSTENNTLKKYISLCLHSHGCGCGGPTVPGLSVESEPSSKPLSRYPWG